MSTIDIVRKNPSKAILADMEKEEAFFLVRHLAFGIYIRQSCFEQLAKGIENNQDQIEKERLWLGVLLQWGASLEDLGAWCLAIQKATDSIDPKPILHTLLTYRVSEALPDNLIMQASSLEDFVNKIGLNEKSFEVMQRLVLIGENITYHDIFMQVKMIFETFQSEQESRYRMKQGYNQLKHGNVVGRCNQNGDNHDYPVIYQLANEQSIAREIISFSSDYLRILKLDFQVISQFIGFLIFIYLINKYPDIIIKTDDGITFKAAQPKRI